MQHQSLIHVILCYPLSLTLIATRNSTTPSKPAMESLEVETKSPGALAYDFEYNNNNNN
jgi:hypothetical protein